MGYKAKILIKLLKTIAKMHKPLSGQVQRTDGQQIYMMHQRYTNFNWLNCLDNVLIAERNRRKRKELKPYAKEVLAVIDKYFKKNAD